jgi:GDP-4-dehydro-6-deoxy-D-mannose reductase
VGTNSPVVVTGGAGFIGSAVIRQAIARGFHAVALVRASEVKQLAPGVDYRVVDWTDSDGLSEAMTSLMPRTILHCAGASARGTKLVSDLYDANVRLTMALLSCLTKDLPGATAVVLSSASVYGPNASVPTAESHLLDPRSHYAVTKVMTEELARSFFRFDGLATKIARPFNLLGPGEPKGSVVSALHRQVGRVAEGETASVRLREIASVRDFVDVDDAARALLVIAERGEAGEAYNVCTEVGSSIAELVKIAGVAWRCGIEVHVEEPGFAGTQSVGSGRRLRELGWKPEHSLLDSLQRMARSCSPTVVAGGHDAL